VSAGPETPDAPAAAQVVPGVTGTGGDLEESTAGATVDAAAPDPAPATDQDSGPGPVAVDEAPETPDRPAEPATDRPTEPTADEATAPAGPTDPDDAAGEGRSAAPTPSQATAMPTPPAESTPDATGKPESSPASTASEDPPPVEASPDTVLPPAGAAAGAATALSAPTMLAPVVRPGGGSARTGPTTSTRSTDPEQVLSSYTWRFHHETLRELVENPDELREVRDRLTAKLEQARDDKTKARLLSLRAVVSRILGDLGKALTDGRLAVEHAEATGELRRIAIAQARLAHVLQWRGDFAEADRLFAEANSSELPDRLRATMHEHAGRSCYDQGRYIEACNHFEKALELRKVEDPDLIARTELALDAVFTKVAGNGWGPYPRTREEILQVRRPPAPEFNEQAQAWGYVDAEGGQVVEPRYADVQPFHDGVAWVRSPESRTWELIDESGTTLIDAAAGYPGVSSFADGLAWVSSDGTGGWVAIDKSNNVVISVGFDDARPFRRGVAAVRRSRWGAVDTRGRVVLPMRYSGFSTALTDGRYLDGFTDEGLAIVDADGRKGVVDRAGTVIVPPAHPQLVIHPVAFLIGNGAGQWGALDRQGAPLIDVVHRSRGDVTDEIDRLLADTKPVL
jgi:Flp pilus assembly protein TadD